MLGRLGGLFRILRGIILRHLAGDIGDERTRQPARSNLKSMAGHSPPKTGFLFWLFAVFLAIFFNDDDDGRLLAWDERNADKPRDRCAR